MNDIRIQIPSSDKCTRVKNLFRKSGIHANISYDRNVECFTPCNCVYIESCNVVMNKNELSETLMEDLKQIHKYTRIIA